MTTEDESSSGSARWIAIAGIIAIAGGLFAWLSLTSDERLPERSGEQGEAQQSTATETAEPEASAVLEAEVAAPRTTIEDKGRLRVRLADLREGELVAVGLDMPDDVRGDGPMATKVVDVERERLIEIEGHAVDGSGTGVRLEIDPEWLEPGQYMIQIETNEESHFPIRRYVLEVE